MTLTNEELRKAPVRSRESLTLRRALESDFTFYKEWVSDDSNRRCFKPMPVFDRYNKFLHSHLLRRSQSLIYTLCFDALPIGIIAFSKLDPSHHPAELWYLLSNKAFAGRGLIKYGVNSAIAAAVSEKNIKTIVAWVVETNRASLSILKAGGFKVAGRLRSMRWLEGEAYGRFVFDLVLPGEYRQFTEQGALALARC